MDCRAVKSPDRPKFRFSMGFLGFPISPKDYAVSVLRVSGSDDLNVAFHIEIEIR
jgi:hypothetical protein